MHHIRFKVGQPVRNKIFDYRGVIVQTDVEFSKTAAWYEVMTSIKPPKEEPWYLVLIDDSPCTSYVPQKELVPDLSGKRINNPFLPEFFDVLEDGLYKRKA